MSNYNRITFKERVRIEAGIYAKKSFSQIAKEIGRSTSSVTREVKQNRIMVKAPYSHGKDCIYPPSCRKTGLCGDEYCSKRCWTCMDHDCTRHCERCVTHTCKKTERAPFVCDSCSEKNKKAYRLETSIEELLKSCKKGNLKYIEWKLNLKITGFVLDENKYGWMFFYSQITDLSVLHHLDWLVEKLLKRYGLIEKIKVKKYVRSYYEITKKLHDTKYIPNLNLLSLEDKRKLITEVYEQQLDDISESKVEYLFRKIMKREIQDIERDVEHIS